MSNEPDSGISEKHGIKAKKHTRHKSVARVNRQKKNEKTRQFPVCSTNSKLRISRG